MSATTPYTRVMPDYDQFARWLIACQKQADADGTIPLSLADAICLRGLGFSTVVPGRWVVPSLPPEVRGRYPALAPFAAKPEPSITRDNATTAVPDQVVPTTASTPASYGDAQRVPAESRVDVRPKLTWRLAEALRHPDHARILRSLARADELGCKKRTLQHNLSKLPAARLNPALDRLVRAGLVLREEHWLALSVEVREALSEALRALEMGVRQAQKARARWRAETRKTHERAEGQTEGQTSTPRKRPYQPKLMPDRRHDPHAWGRSRLARRGGLAVQKEYRRLGLHPTAPATAAGQAKRDDRHGDRFRTPHRSRSQTCSRHLA